MTCQNSTNYILCVKILYTDKSKITRDSDLKRKDNFSKYLNTKFIDLPITYPKI